MSASADRLLQRVWYDGHARWLSFLLLPLSWLFAIVVAGRRSAYRSGVLRRARVGRPVAVVGNITVGGTGKTPLTIWLAEQLCARGHRVGIVLRGYGGRSRQWPRDVEPDTSWEDVGDEAVLLAQRTGAVVVAGPDRVADARRAIERGADIVLSDDGLQHYRLARDCEIAVLDAQRGFGNGRLLPAGPLREPPARLAEVDLRILMQRGPALQDTPASAAIEARPYLRDAVSLTTGEVQPLHNFKNRRVHAVAGIGHPAAFFAALVAAGVRVEAHPMPDHARLRHADICFADEAPVLMTEKDAVKCRAIADRRHWAVRMDVAVAEHDAAAILGLLERRAGA